MSLRFEVAIPQININKTLVIKTYKGSDDIRTIASVVEISRKDGYSTETHVIFQDFNKCVARTQPKRRTDKMLQQQHESIVSDPEKVQKIIDNAVAHYAE